MLAMVGVRPVGRSSLFVGVQMIDASSKSVRAHPPLTFGMSRSGAVWFIFQFLCLACVIPVLVLNAVGVSATTPILVLVIIGISSIALARNGSTRAGWTRLLDTSFWVFVYVFFGIAALAQRSANSFPWGPLHLSSNTWFLTDMIVLLGCAAYLVGRISTPGISRTAILRLVKRRVVWLTAPILIGTISVSLATLGLSGFTMYREARSAALLEASGSTAMSLILSAVINSPLVVIMPALILLLPHRDNRSRLSQSALTIVAVAATLFMINFFTSARYLAGAVLLSGIIAFLLLKPRRNKWLKLLPLAIPLGFILVFPLASFFRRGFASVAGLPGNIVNPLIGSGDFDAYRQLALSVDLVGSMGTVNGKNLISALGFWVPRGLWGGKLPQTGEILGRFANQSYVNLSAPLWAEGVLAFGGFGVFILLFLWGVSAKILDRGVYRDVVLGRTDSSLTLLATILFGFSFFLLRGALMSGLAYLAPIVAVTLALSWFTRRPEGALHRKATR